MVGGPGYRRIDAPVDVQAAGELAASRSGGPLARPASARRAAPGSSPSRLGSRRAASADRPAGRPQVVAATTTPSTGPSRRPGTSWRECRTAPAPRQRLLEHRVANMLETASTPAVAGSSKRLAGSSAIPSVGLIATPATAGQLLPDRRGCISVVMSTAVEPHLAHSLEPLSSAWVPSRGVGYSRRRPARSARAPLASPPALRRTPRRRRPRARRPAAQTRPRSGCPSVRS